MTVRIPRLTIPFPNYRAPSTPNTSLEHNKYGERVVLTKEFYNISFDPKPIEEYKYSSNFS